MTLASFPALQKLPNRQKLELADALWQAGISDDTPVAPRQKKELDRRWADLRSGKAKTMSLAELERRLDAQ